MSSGMLKRHCAWLAAASRFTVYWFLWKSQICQFRQWSDKKNFASKWNNFTTGNSQQRDARNQVGFLPLSLTRPEWQTQTTVRSWKNIRPWSFTGEQWHKQTEIRSENGWNWSWHHQEKKTIQHVKIMLKRKINNIFFVKNANGLCSQVHKTFQTSAAGETSKVIKNIYWR